MLELWISCGAGEGRQRGRMRWVLRPGWLKLPIVCRRCAQT